MKNPYTGFMFTLLLIIIVLIIFNTALANHTERDKSKSQWLNENPCMIKVITTSKEHIDSNGDKITTVTKEEVLKCKDGYDGPNYWELFAQFYYTGLTPEPYCRWVARPDHPFKTPKEVCLNEKGVWKAKNKLWKK
jgi:hypothetical protein